MSTCVLLEYIHLLPCKRLKNKFIVSKSLIFNSAIINFFFLCVKNIQMNSKFMLRSCRTVFSRITIFIPTKTRWNLQYLRPKMYSFSPSSKLLELFEITMFYRAQSLHPHWSKSPVDLVFELDFRANNI